MTQTGAPPRRLGDLLSGCDPRKLVERPRPDLCSSLQAAEAARLVIGCYRMSDCADPETYVRASSLVFSSYSPAVVVAVTDPRSGIAARLKWLPSIAELNAACESERLRRERTGRKPTPTGADTMPAKLSPEDADRRREVVAAWRASLRPTEGGPTTDTTEKATEKLDRLKAEYAATPATLGPEVMRQFAKGDGERGAA